MSISPRPYPLGTREDIDPAPPPAILQAFGVDGDPILLGGGEGRSFRVGDAVFKPARDPIEAEWSLQVMAHLASMQTPNFRVPTPLQASNNQCVFEGWTASEFVSGVDKIEGRWEELLDVSRALHEALRDVPKPEFMADRSHIWAKADRVAWGEASIEISSPLRQVFKDLMALRQDVDAKSQVIHGDLTGNVLFEETLPPVVIDFSPYWRPAEFADAIIVADGLLDHNQSRELVRLNGTSKFCLQMVVRALIFRLVSESELSVVRGIMSEAGVRRFDKALGIVQAELAMAE